MRKFWVVLVIVLISGAVYADIGYYIDENGIRHLVNTDNKKYQDKNVKIYMKDKEQPKIKKTKKQPVKKEIVADKQALIKILDNCSQDAGRPGGEIVLNGIAKHISSRESMPFTWIVTGVYDINAYSLKRDGEKIFCYDMTYTYRAAELPGFEKDFGTQGVMSMVKRGDRWYLY